MRYIGEDPVEQSMKSQITDSIAQFKARLKDSWFALAKVNADLKTAQFKADMNFQLYYNIADEMESAYDELAKFWLMPDDISGDHKNWFKVSNSYAGEFKNYVFYHYLNGYDDISFLLTGEEGINNYFSNLDKSSWDYSLYRVFEFNNYNFGQFLQTYSERLYKIIFNYIDARNKINLYSSMQVKNQSSFNQVKAQIDSFNSNYADLVSQYPDIILKSSDDLMNDILNEPEIQEAPPEIPEILVEVANQEEPIITEEKPKSKMPIILGALAVAGVILGGGSK